MGDWEAIRRVAERKQERGGILVPPVRYLLPLICTYNYLGLSHLFYVIYLGSQQSCYYLDRHHYCHPVSLILLLFFVCVFMKKPWSQVIYYHYFRDRFIYTAHPKAYMYS
ncbi:hypothetical protein HD806DRAFT_272110 [Xylariaceae sp. AK1471]|nr:hypothetical protein HD806DRAFT_272110 [Xylariaceae sp. AK1471]